MITKIHMFDIMLLEIPSELSKPKFSNSIVREKCFTSDNLSLEPHTRISICRYSFNPDLVHRLVMTALAKYVCYKQCKIEFPARRLSYFPAKKFPWTLVRLICREKLCSCVSCTLRRYTLWIVHLDKHALERAHSAGPREFYEKRDVYTRCSFVHT